MEFIKCSYQLILIRDSKLIESQSIDQLNKILYFLRIVMQILLKKPPLYWLLFNGTVMIYEICRNFIALNCNKASTLEFSLWAAMTMEHSAPLLTLHYLEWRTTCYLVVSQAYIELGGYKQAEEFTRRAIAKVMQLKQIEQVAESKFTQEQQNDLFSKSALRVKKNKI